MNVAGKCPITTLKQIIMNQEDFMIFLCRTNSLQKVVKDVSSLCLSYRIHCDTKKLLPSD